MIKQYFLAAIAIVLCAHLARVPATAQSTGSVNFSPALIVYDEPPNTNLGSQIEISNHTDTIVGYSIRIVGLQRKDGQLAILEPETDLYDVTLSQDFIAIDARSKRSINVNVKVREQLLAANTVPGVAFTAQNNTPNQVDISQQVIIPIPVSFTSQQPHLLDTQLETVPIDYIFTPEFTINGLVTNLQNRYFKPVGRVELWAGQKRVMEFSINDQLPESLNPNTPVKVVIDAAGVDLDSFTNYQVKLFLTDTVTGQRFLGEVGITYINVTLVIVATVALLIMLTSAIILLIIRVRHRRHLQ